MTDSAVLADLRPRIKALIIERLKLDRAPDSIGDEEPLFGEGLGLDSIDALELVLGLEQEFDVKVEDQEVGSKVLATVSTIAEFVLAKRALASAGS